MPGSNADVDGIPVVWIQPDYQGSATRRLRQAAVAPGAWRKEPRMTGAANARLRCPASQLGRECRE